MKATGIVRRIDDLGRVVIPKEIRRTLRIREGDPSQITLARWERFCFAMLDLSRRWGAGLYIVTEDEGATVGIREGGNVKKCRPVVKEPSGGTLLFRCALPARGASRKQAHLLQNRVLCLGAACTRCIGKSRQIVAHHFVAYAVSR